MEDLWTVAVAVFQLWMFVVVFFITLPAMFGLSLGVTSVYIQILVKLLEWATIRIQRGRQEQPSVPAPLPNGIIERAEGSMEEEMEQLRRSRSLEGGEFALSDALYFCKKGLESIVDDQVTQRFSSEELASWNLLTRTNQNFRYISLRLTIFWGIGVFVRYCVLFPLRSVCHSSTSHLPGEALISASLAFATGTAALTAVKQFSQRHVSVLSGHSSALLLLTNKHISKSSSPQCSLYMCSLYGYTHHSETR